MEDLSGKSRSYLSEHETGKLSPSIRQLEEICPFCGIEPREAVAGLPKLDLARMILGPAPAGDPLLTELQHLLEGPEGQQALEFLVAFEKENPGRMVELLKVAKAVKELRQGR